jgi:predicted O-methyltransferase YrrM
MSSDVSGQHPLSRSKVQDGAKMTEFPDWFSAYAKPNFEKYLIPLAGQQYLQCLQIGAYTGDASLWLLENVLTGEFSQLIDIDTWLGSDEEVHETIDFNEVYTLYKERMQPFSNVTSIINTSFNTLQFLKESFDFVYIDGDHTAAGVLLDAELSWYRLRAGGIMAFDDYEWGAHLPASKSPKLGINLFIERHQGEFITLEVGLQYWIQKL